MATAANQCDGGSGDCVLEGPNDRVCQSGPLETFCGPVETFRGCAVDSDCSRPGDTCRVSRFRACFDNGIIDEVVTAEGSPEPVCNVSEPVLGSLFCVGPTTSASVNVQVGLPGLGRLTFPVVESGE
jgi:hypothetical protein